MKPHGDGALGDFVHPFAVDEGFDIVAGANSHVRVPFADGFFIRFAVHGNRRVGVHAFVFLAFRAGHHEQVALPAGLALVLDAHRPDLVGQLHVDEHPGVVGLGRDFHEAPFNGHHIIAVGLCRAEITGRYAGAMDHAIGDAPGFPRISVVFHAKRPAIKIRAVESQSFMWFACVIHLYSLD